MRNYLYASRFFIAAAIVAGGLTGFGCTDNSGNGPGNPGAGGTSAGTAGTTATGTAGTTGTGGSGGTSAGGSGGTGGTSTGGTGGTTPGFMSVLPCTSESMYVTWTADAGAGSDGGPPIVNFGFINNANAYDPKCLKVPAGTSVTFSGDFGMHPLYPSGHRGAQTGSPIVITSSIPDGGTTKDFTFSTPGFYAYFCAEHDTTDTGMFMDGVVWVQ